MPQSSIEKKSTRNSKKTVGFNRKRIETYKGTGREEKITQSYAAVEHQIKF